MAPSPKWGHATVPGGKNGAIQPSLEGCIAPFCQNGAISPSRRSIWPQASRTRKEGGGEAILVSGRAVWPHFAGGGEVFRMKVF